MEKERKKYEKEQKKSCSGGNCCGDDGIYGVRLWTKATPENLFNDMSKNMKDVESVLCNMNMEASLTDGTDSMEMSMKLEVEATQKPEAAHLKGNVSIGVSGTDMSTEVEGYSVKEDDKYVSYSMVENEWSKTEMDESEVDVTQ